MASARIFAAILLPAMAVSAYAEGLLPAKPKADALLPVDQAFVLQGAKREGKDVTLTWNISPGYYLYGHQFKVKVESPAGTPAPKLTLPKGETKHDAEFGDVTVFRGETVVTLTDAATPRTLRVSYQGCADAGVCYPPQTRLVAVR